MYEIFECSTLPTSWVVSDPDGKFWIVPASVGWSGRTAYRGHREGLRPVPTVYRIGLGIPGPMKTLSAADY